MTLQVTIGKEVPGEFLWLAERPPRQGVIIDYIGYDLPFIPKESRVPAKESLLDRARLLFEEIHATKAGLNVLVLNFVVFV